MAINSRDKGKRGERAAAEFLRELGFADARRTQQFNGKGDGDVTCPDSLPRIHFEIKVGAQCHNYLGKAEWLAACQQAKHDCPAGRVWVVLWKPDRAQTWCLTYEFDRCCRPFYATVAGHSDIWTVLFQLNMGQQPLKAAA